MLRQEAEQGIGRVIATPHFYPQQDSPERFLQRRESAWQMLRTELSNFGDLPEISLGAEVLFFFGMSNSEILQQMTIDGQESVLVEMPPPPWTDTMFRELEGIYHNLGLIPIIAHVDRYVQPFRTHGIPQRLAEMPVMVQANASFFIRPSTGRMAVNMLKKKQIQLLGSDCHNLTNRPPNLGKAIQQIQKSAGAAAIEYIEASQYEILQEP